MNRLRHLWLAIVGERASLTPAHEHSAACSPITCGHSRNEFRQILHSAAVDAATIAELRTALRPLADMHVEHVDESLILYQRTQIVPKGHPAIITMGDCHRAFYLLDEHNI